MKRETLRKEIHHAIDNTEDSEILEVVHLILKKAATSHDEAAELTPAQKKDLDKRLADHHAGKLKYYTSEQMRETVLKAIKK